MWKSSQYLWIELSIQSNINNNSKKKLPKNFRFESFFLSISTWMQLPNAITNSWKTFSMDQMDDGFSTLYAKHIRLLLHAFSNQFSGCDFWFICIAMQRNSCFIAYRSKLCIEHRFKVYKPMIWPKKDLRHLILPDSENCEIFHLQMTCVLHKKVFCSSWNWWQWKMNAFVRG